MLLHIALRRLDFPLDQVNSILYLLRLSLKFKTKQNITILIDTLGKCAESKNKISQMLFPSTVFPWLVKLMEYCGDNVGLTGGWRGHLSL